MTHLTLVISLWGILLPICMVLQTVWSMHFLFHGTSLTLQILIHVFDWLFSMQCLTSFFFIEHLLRLSAGLILFNIDEVLTTNSSVNMFVFGDFNVHHKDRLIYSGEADRLGEPCYNFSMPNNLTQIVNFPTWTAECDSLNPVFFCSGFPSIAILWSCCCLTLYWLSFKLKTGCPFSSRSDFQAD